MGKFKKANSDGIVTETFKLKTSHGKIPVMILKPETPVENPACVMWIHGGGYCLGNLSMIYISLAIDLVKKFGVTVVAPGYHLSWFHPYPAALEECYETLLYIKNNAGTLGINKNQIFVGGESAGGGLCAAVTMLARDKGEINIAYHMPIYPMIDNFDTESSKNNHGKNWNTKRNHIGWKLYLRKNAKKEVSPYAAPSRQKDFSNLPPAYTFVGTREPFYCETLTYVENLKKAGIEASVDIYDTNVHGFDMENRNTDLAKKAVSNFLEKFDYALKNYSKEN